MNKIILKGNLGKDPEIKTFDWGKVAKFSLATTESYKNKDGEKITETEWHNLVFKGNVCDVIEKYLHKGDQIIVEGKIKTRTYKIKEVDHWATEIICDNFEFCGTKQENKKEDKKNGPPHESGFSDINDLPGSAEDDPSYDPTA